TANIYSNGESEKILGKFLKTARLIYNILQHNFVIVTKARFILAHNDLSVMSGWQLMNKLECVNQGGLSHGTLFSQVKGSLERLGTTYIDVLVISGDQNIPVPETMKALHDLVHKVRYRGTSVPPTSTCGSSRK
ncbi:NADP-dependent oxidoreductase domain-containing protein, partial [Mycena albidolilacea]